MMELTNTPALGPHDQIDVTGVVTLETSGTGVYLDLDTSQYTQETGTIILINNDGSGDPVVGTFVGLPEGGMTNFGNTPNFQISYVGGDGNDIELTAVGPTALTVDHIAAKSETNGIYMISFLLAISSWIIVRTTRKGRFQRLE
jgi:hypothetical protein